MAVILLGWPGVPGPIPLRGHLFFPAPGTTPVDVLTAVFHYLYN
jgi:hypothetical protein